MSWPNGADPWYLANQNDNNTRRYYYGVNATPTFKCDGSGCSTSQSAVVSSINNRLAVPSLIWLDLEATLNGGNLDVTCTAVSDVNISGNVTLHLVLMERYVFLTSPNGQNNHYHPMVDMAPDGNGQTFSSTAGDTTHFYGSFPMSPSWDIENLDMACFVQNNTSREVLQAHCEVVPVDFPGLNYIDYTLTDNGNNNGRAEAGEEAYLNITLGNGQAYLPATNVVGTLSTTDPDLNITTATVDFPDILNGATGTNVDAFVFDVSPTLEPHTASFHLEVVADPGQTVMTADFEMFIGWADVLLVDDDGTGIVETYYQSALDNLGVTYEDWQVSTQGTPTPTVMDGYTIMVWFTGWETADVLNADERTVIENFLDSGGYFFLSGQNIAQGLATSAPDFLTNVLHAEFGTANTLVKLLDGVGMDPLWNTLSVNCYYGGSGSGTCTSPDGITATVSDEVIFEYTTAAYDGGIAYENANTGRVVFFSYPFEAISGQNGTNTREEVMQAVIDYFGGTPGVEPQVEIPVTHALVKAYPNPFNPLATIEYVLPHSTQVRLAVYDVSGAQVATLVDGWTDAGRHEAFFDGTELASGVYVYRLEAGDFVSSGKMVLMK